MSRVQPVGPMTWKNVGKEADRFISLFYPNLLLKPGPFPVLKFLEFQLHKLGWSWEIADLKHGCEAEVDFEYRVLRLSEQTYLDLHVGKQRARFTVMHEVGHIWLHSKHFEKILRKERPNVVMQRKKIPAYKDPECQANAFGSCALMPSRHVISMLAQGKGATELHTVFDVSTEAAMYKIKGIDKFK